MSKQLMQLIDNQDIEKIKEFMELNPQTNLNNFTGTGIGAVIYALNPPPGKQASIELVKLFLEDKKTNPGNTYLGHRLVDLAQDPEIRKLLKDYETTYTQDNRAAEQGELGAFVNDRQNTHDSKIVANTDDSIVRLYKRYINEKETEVVLDQSFKDYGTALGKDPSLKKTMSSALNAFRSIQRAKLTTRPYKISDDLTVELTNLQVLALLWKACCDTSSESYVMGADMKEDEQKNRKKRLFENLAEAQNEYGTNNSACWMGMRNKMVSTLDATHLDVRVTSNIPMDKEMVNWNYSAWCNKQLSNLERENPELFHQFIHYSLLRELPGGCSEKDKDPVKLTHWINETKESFKQFIKKENAQLAEELQMKEEELTKIISEFDYLPLNHSSFFELNELDMLVNKMASPSIALLIDANIVVKKITEARENNRSVNQLMTDIKQDLLMMFDSQKLATFLTQKSKNKEEYKQLLDNLKEPEKTLWLQNHWPKIIDFLIQDTGFNPTTDQLSAQVASDIATAIPELAQWMNGLPNEQRNLFYQQVLKGKWFIDYAQNKQQVMNAALGFALETGYLNHFNLQNPIVLENKDLRGCNLRTLNLEKVTFINCDLRLTNIVLNPQFTKEHVASSLFDPIAIHWSCLKSSRALQLENLLSSERCSSSDLATTDNRGYSALHRSVIDYKWDKDVPTDALNRLLSSPHCTDHIVHIQGEDGNSVLHLTAEHGSSTDVDALLKSHHDVASLLKLTNSENDSVLHLIVLSPYSTKIDKMLKNSLLTEEHFLAKGKEGNTVLHNSLNAYSQATEKVVNHKICSSKMLDAMNNAGQTVLAYALVKAHVSGFETLIKCQHCTPQHFATPPQGFKSWLHLAETADRKFPRSKKKFVDLITQSPHYQAAMQQAAIKGKELARREEMNQIISDFKTTCATLENSGTNKQVIKNFMEIAEKIDNANNNPDVTNDTFAEVCQQSFAQIANKPELAKVYEIQFYHARIQRCLSKNTGNSSLQEQSFFQPESERPRTTFNPDSGMEPS